MLGNRKTAFLSQLIAMHMWQRAIARVKLSSPPTDESMGEGDLVCFPRHPQRSSEWMEDPAIMSISPVAASRANWVRAHSLRGISAYCALCVVSRLGIAILSPTNFAILRIAASRMRDSEQSPLTAAALPPRTRPLFLA